MNTKVYCALVVLICTTRTAAVEAPVVSSGSPDSDPDISIWTHFTTAWNRSHETEYTPRELRAQLPGVTTAEVAWVLAERNFNEEALVTSHLSTEHLLLDAPVLRLVGKAVGDVASISVAASSYATTHIPAPTPVRPTAGEEDLLWSSLEEILGDFASLRGTEPVKELLWLSIAQDLDEQVWRETGLTAEDLLSMPSHGLLRKTIADVMTEMMIASVLGQNVSIPGADPAFCRMAYNTSMAMCDLIAVRCKVLSLFPGQYRTCLDALT